MTHTPTPHVLTAGITDSLEFSEEEIAFRVNAHDELVAALKRCVKCLDLYGVPSALNAVKNAKDVLAKVQS